jgi:hypothetical protein
MSKVKQMEKVEGKEDMHTGRHTMSYCQKLWPKEHVECSISRSKRKRKKEERTKSRTCIAKKTAEFKTRIGFSLDSKIEKTIQGGCE